MSTLSLLEGAPGSSQGCERLRPQRLEWEHWLPFFLGVELWECLTFYICEMNLLVPISQNF